MSVIASSKRARLVLISTHPDLGFALGDGTALRLLQGLLAADEQERRRLLHTLAQEDPSWAAWLANCPPPECAPRANDRAGATRSAPNRAVENGPAWNLRWAASSADCVRPCWIATVLVPQLTERLRRVEVSTAAWTDWQQRQRAAFTESGEARLRRVPVWRLSESESMLDQVGLLTAESAGILPRAAERVADLTGAPLPEPSVRVASELRLLAAGDVTAASAAVHWCWEEDIPQAVDLLPNALERLSRLAVLESEFHERLELEKLAAMKQLAYGASHEINNPLANISSRAQLLLRDEEDPQRRRSLATINSQAFRAHEMIADMMLFAKPPQLELQSVDWHGFVASIVDDLRGRQVSPLTVNLVRDGATAAVRLDPVQIQVAVRALWDNALEAGERQPVVEVRVWIDSAGLVEQGGAWAVLEMQDNGRGISAEVRRHLFDPFYSGREAGRGLGFGLTKAWRIVERHGGQILVDSQVGQGATLTMRLPIEA